MASVLDQLSKKLEVLSEGRIYEESLFEPENLIAIWTLDDPKIYKPIFNLDNKGGLAIERTLKSLLVELKDSLCTFYYVLDSSCMSIDLTCTYQTLETIKEIPLAFISYMRILCSKKASIEISIDDNFIYIVFEDSIVKDKEPKPKLKKGEKREKEVGKKYVLELPLSNPNNLDLAIIELFKEVWESNKEYDSVDSSLPIDLSNILYDKEPLQLTKYEVKTNKGKLGCIATDGLFLNIVVCPMEVANSYAEKYVISTSSFEANEYTIPQDINEIGEELDD